MTARLTVLGVPSSAGAFAPGQELAPRALREQGLLEDLENAGWQLNDLGDLAPWRWRPDPGHRFAQNLAEVVGHVQAAATRLIEPARDGDSILVLGGDCTVGLATIAAQPDPQAIQLVYFDMHADLNVPSSTKDGALDWMGMAHALGNEEGTPELSHIGRRFPLLQPEQLVVLGYEASQSTAWERKCIQRYGLRTISATEVMAGPEAAARAALRHLAADDTNLLVHFDVDVIDFVDAPLSENTGRNVGISLDAAGRALAVLAADSRFRAVTVTELNPLHGAEDRSTLARFVGVLVEALRPPKRD